jgi:thiol:disulfide interchange protein
MPFGAIFGIVFFGLVCPWLGLQFFFLPLRWGPAGSIGLALGAFGLTMSLGLLLKRGWARWLGALLAIPTGLLAVLLARHAVSAFPALQRGFSVVTLVVLLGAVPTTALLLLPATGSFSRGGPPPATDSSIRRRLGGIVAASTGVALAGLLASAVWGWATPPPGRELRAAWTDVVVDWSDFGPALERAREQDKLILVDFFATWCGPCHTMDQVTFRDARVVEALNRDVVAVRVDAEGTDEVHGYVGEELALRYGVLTYPTLALIDGQGRLVSKRSGFQHADQLLGWLQQTLSDTAGSSATVL